MKRSFIVNSNCSNSTQSSKASSYKGEEYKCLLKGQFLYNEINTHVLVYSDSISFWNVEELTILSYKTQILFQPIQTNQQFCGFILYQNDIEYKFQNHNNCNDSRLWAQALNKHLIKRGFEKYFQLTKKIGQGAFGRVYKARQISTNNQVAVKIFFKQQKIKKITQKQNQKQKQHYLNKIKQSFYNQLKILRKIQHNNIVKLLNACQSDQAYYLVFQYENKHTTLTQFLYSHRLKQQQRKFILSQLLQVLQYLHFEQKVLHQDIKPSNILIHQQTLEVKLIDFGLSAEFDDIIIRNEQNKSDIQWCGTIGYISPECYNIPKKYLSVADSSYNLSKRDIYSLGVVFYQILFNKQLFTGKTKRQVQSKNESNEIDYEELDCFKEIYSDEQIQLLKKMLELNPHKRISIKQAFLNRYFNQQNQFENEKSLINQQANNYILHYQLNPENQSSQSKFSLNIYNGQQNKNYENKIIQTQQIFVNIIPINSGNSKNNQNDIQKLENTRKELGQIDLNQVNFLPSWDNIDTKQTMKVQKNDKKQRKLSAYYYYQLIKNKIFL